MSSQPIDTRNNAARILSFGRFLRTAAGVDETLIRQVWPDRHRYTGLGGIVLGTAAMASASMLLAIALMVEEFRWYFVLGPLLWGLLVFNLDRWLVSSTHGVGRPWKLLPRLVIALLFGFVIAEPVVLWVFNDAIEERILDDRAEEVGRAISQLKICNPEDDPVAGAERRTDPACDGLIVDRSFPAPSEIGVVDNSIATGTQEGSALIVRQERLLEDVARIDGEIADLEEANRSSLDRYEREIRGDGSSDTTGRTGIGPVASAIQATIDLRQEDIDELEIERSAVLSSVGDIDAELVALETAQAVQDDQGAADRAAQQARGDVRLVEYSLATSSAVAERIEEIESRNGVQIGLLQRFDALSDLAGDHSHILIARWLLTGLLIAVDSMPVIAKAIGGKSAYDRVHSLALDESEQDFTARSSARKDQHLKELELTAYERSLKRTVARRRSTTDATAEIYESDDLMERIHSDRSMSWGRREVTFSESGVLLTTPPDRTRIPEEQPPEDAQPIGQIFDQEDSHDKSRIGRRNSQAAQREPEDLDLRFGEARSVDSSPRSERPVVDLDSVVSATEQARAPRITPTGQGQGDAAWLTALAGSE